MYQKMKELLLLVVILSAIVGATYLLAPQNLALYKVSPHPFFIVSVLMSAYYGLSFSFVASFSCSALYLYLLDRQLDYQVVESLFEYQYLSFPLVMIFVSTVVGEFKQFSLNKLNLALDQNESSKNIIENLKEDLKAKDLELNELSLRLVNKEDTIQKNYETAILLSERQEELLVKNFLKVLRDESEAKTLGFYLIDQERESLELKYRLGESEEIQTLVNLKEEDGAPFSLCLKKKRQVNIQDYKEAGLKAQSEEVPSLIIPVVLEDRLYGVISIFGIPFLKYVPALFSVLEMLTKWLETSLLQSQEFHHLQRNQNWNFLYNVFDAHFIDSMHRDIKRFSSISIFEDKLRINLFEDNPKKQEALIRMSIEVLKNILGETYPISFNQDESCLEVGLWGKAKEDGSFIEKISEGLLSFGLTQEKFLIERAEHA